MNAEHEHRLLVAAERIGTGLLRLAAAAEARNVADAERRAEEEPRDIVGLWMRPSDVEAVWKSTAKHSGYDRDVVRVRLRDTGEVFVIWRAHHGFPWYYDETHDECLTRVLTALGWA